MDIKPREKTAILQSLAAGVVPKVGLHHIQVGRKREIEALISDLKLIEEGASAIRFVIGRFGSGKSFFLNLVRTVALERKFVVLQADITLNRKFHSSSGEAQALFTELVNNMSTRAKPEGGGMPGLVERFVTDVHNEAGSKVDSGALEKIVGKRLQSLLDMTYGSSFVRVLARYVEGHAKHNDDLINAALRWLRGEFNTKTEAREALGVRDIIGDAHVYDMLKLWAQFIRIAGHKGLFVNFDEMVVLSERLNNSQARTKNYEVLLQMLNDCLQGRVEGIGFCFAGTDEFLTDRRRGLHSYEALATRLAENPFTASGTVDTKSPVVRLQALTPEEVFVLLERVASVHASERSDKPLVDHDGITQFIKFCERRLGANHFLTPRDTVKLFVGLLNAMEQNPEKNLASYLNTLDATTNKGPDTTQANTDSNGDALIKFKV